MAQRQTLLPGAELVTTGNGAETRRTLIGIPPCFKVFARGRIPSPNLFVVPDEAFALGVPQVSLEFFVYDDLFVPRDNKPGKAFRAFDSSERMVVIGTPEQLQRVRRITEVTLFGFSPDEMRGWYDERGLPELRDADIDTLRRFAAWFAPKRTGFGPFQKFVLGLAHDPSKQLINSKDPSADLPALVHAFFAKYGEQRFARPFDVVLAAYEFGRFTLDDLIEWRPYDADGNAPLANGATIHRNGDNTFRVTDSEQVLDVSAHVTEDQAPHLVTLPPSPGIVESGLFQMTWLGARSGFDAAGETTGVLVDVNHESVLVDTPLCPSYLLRHIGRDPASVRAFIETHVHEDHHGAGAAAALGADYLRAGRSFTLVGSAPTIRGTAVRIATYLGISEDDAYDLLARQPGDPTVAPQSVITVRPGDSIRLLGADWHFPTWNPHPVPTLGFRTSLAYRGRTYTVGYTSDTAPQDGGTAKLGTDHMLAAGFLLPQEEPLPLLIRDGDDLAVLESGGSNGDPIHPSAAEWAPWCAVQGFTRAPPVIVTHTGLVAPSLRHYMRADGGTVVTIAKPATPTERYAAAIETTLAAMPVQQRSSWLRRFVAQGEIVEFFPGATVVAEGEASDAWYQLLHGDAEVLVGGRHVGDLSAHAFFGELGLIGNGTNGTGARRATVRAKTPLVCLKIPANVFRDFVVGEDLVPYFSEFWQRVGTLKQAQLFVGFPHEVIERLVGRVATEEFIPGARLLTEGETGDFLYVLQQGAVGVVRTTSEGEPVVVATLDQIGSVVGEYGVLVPGGKRTATVTASTFVRALKLTRGDLDAVLAGQLPLQLRIIALLERRGITVTMPAVQVPTSSAERITLL